jgi:nucleoside-diphosphate-sugar epimerase
VRVAVTGASGFIGGRVARALEQMGHEVQSFGRRPPSQLVHHAPNNVEWDIAHGPRDLSDVEAVVHCAARVGQWGHEAAYAAVNVRGTQHVVDSTPTTARMVYVSSGSVHHTGHVPAYARTKRLAESVVLESGRCAIVLRPHIVYGPGDTTLWPRVRDARRNSVLRLPGDGTNRVAVTHVDNLVHAVERALVVSPLTGTFDIADSIEPSMRELLETMFARHGESVHLQLVPRGVAWPVATLMESVWSLLGRTTDPPLTRYLVQSLADPFSYDIEPARQQLGYRPTHTFCDGPL